MAQAVIHLLDASQGHTLQTWTFVDKDSITLGRSDVNDIVLSDPYVSRLHARMLVEDNGWRLVSISQQRVIHQGETLTELLLYDGAVIRLGPMGSFLRFATGL